jgi:hypothetical protein
MSDDELCSKMDDILVKVKEIYHDRDQKFNLLKKYFSLYNKLNPEFQNKIPEKDLYFANELIGGIYFGNRLYKDALDHLMAVYHSPLYKKQDPRSTFFIRRNIMGSCLNYLENDPELLKEIIIINDSLIKDKEKGIIHFEGTSKRDKVILDIIERETPIKTIVNFEISIPIIPILKNLPIKFNFEENNYELNLWITETSTANIPYIKSNNSILTVPKDKYGLFKKTIVEITVDKFIDPSENIKIKSITNSGYENVLKIILDVIGPLNYFIEHYRNITENFWIKKVNYKMIANFTTSYVPEVQSPILSTNQPIEFGPTLSRLDDEKEKELENSLNKGSLELWEILLLDAKDYLLSMDYREAIYSINGAFENYIILRAKEMVEGVERKKRFLKKLNSEWPPSAYKIVDECLEFNNKSKVSIDDLNKMIKIIRTKREAVIHGEDVDDEDDLVIIAFEAITTFEKFV